MSQLHEFHPVVNGLVPQVPDNDPQETAEWVESLSGLINEKGGPRARYILLHMLNEARRNGVQLPQEYTTPEDMEAGTNLLLNTILKLSETENLD